VDPQPTSAMTRCAHGLLCPAEPSLDRWANEAECEICRWESAFYVALYDLAAEGTIRDLQRLRRRWVARLRRRRDLGDSERARRLALVRQEVGLWIADSRREANWTVGP
jgi:hypothetical protein